MLVYVEDPSSGVSAAARNALKRNTSSDDREVTALTAELVSSHGAPVPCYIKKDDGTLSTPISSNADTVAPIDAGGKDSVMDLSVSVWDKFTPAAVKARYAAYAEHINANGGPVLSNSGDGSIDHTRPAAGYSAEFTVVARDTKKPFPIAQALLDLVEEKDASFVVVGVDGVRALVESHTEYVPSSFSSSSGNGSGTNKDDNESVASSSSESSATGGSAAAMGSPGRGSRTNGVVGTPSTVGAASGLATPTPASLGMGTPGASGQHSLLHHASSLARMTTVHAARLGSNTDYVMRNAHCNVVLVQKLGLYTDTPHTEPRGIATPF